MGTVVKTHGTKGELKLDIFEKIQLKKWAFLEIKGKPIPFLILDQFGSQEMPILKLEGVDTPAQASRFIGAEVLAERKGKLKKAVTNQDSVIGFTLVDETVGEIGVVEDLVELPQQLLFQTTYHGNETLIPAVDEFVIEINEKKKIIILNLPEGLL